MLKRYEIPDADGLVVKSPRYIAARIRAALREWGKVIEGGLGVTPDRATDIAAETIGFENVAALEQEFSRLEAEPPGFPSPDACAKMFSVLVKWPGSEDAGGAKMATSVRNGYLAAYVVIGHSHAHALAKSAGIALPDALNLSARLHNASTWAEYVYGTAYWTDMALVKRTT